MALEILKNAQYYNKPDGEDYVGKMIATNKYMLMAAIPIAFHDVVMVSKPKGVLATLARYGKWVGPAIGMASAFTTATYLACNLRGKNDKINYIFGSCAAAGVFGKAIRNPVVGFQMCVFFSIAGVLKKVSIDEGWTWFPTDEFLETYHVYGTLRTPKYDWTLVKDTAEKGWTTKAE